VDQTPRHLTGEQRQALCEEALALYRELGDRRGTSVALITLGLTCLTGDARRARALFEEGTVVLRQLGGSRALAWACLHLGSARYLVGEYEPASEVARECLPLFEQYADLVGIAACHDLQGRIALAQGDLPNARRHFVRSRESNLEVGSQSGVAEASTSCNRLGDVELAEGDVAAAEALYERALAVARERNTTPLAIEALIGLGRSALRRGDATAAASRFGEALSTVRDWNPGQYALACLEGLAYALTLEAGAAGDPGPPATGARSAATPGAPRLLRAAGLLGAAEAVRERIGIRRPPREQSEHDGQIAALRASLGNANFTAAGEAGWARSWQETIDLALETSAA
jgi:tetratricopeptide (TPR) repeat protein